MRVSEDHMPTTIHSPVCLASIMKKSTPLLHMAKVQLIAVEYICTGLIQLTVTIYPPESGLTLNTGARVI